MPRDNNMWCYGESSQEALLTGLRTSWDVSALKQCSLSITGDIVGAVWTTSASRQCNDHCLRCPNQRWKTAYEACMHAFICSMGFGGGMYQPGSSESSAGEVLP